MDFVDGLLKARRARPDWPGLPPGTPEPKTIAEAYRLQAVMHDRMKQAGAQQRGYKIGSTSAAGQAVWGLKEPVYAGIFEEDRSDSLTSALARPFRMPSLETEIAVILGAPVAPGASRAEVADAVASCHIACEIIDQRYGDPVPIGVPALLVDDFFQAGFVLGAANETWRALELGTLDAELQIDDKTFTGNAANVMHALDAVAWLAGKLHQSGRALAAGDVILTGSLIPPKQLDQRPDTVRLWIDGFEPLVHAPKRARARS